MAINLIDLEVIATNGCQVPSCNHKDHNIFYLHPHCHPTSKLEISYRVGSGCMLIACAQCRAPVGEVLVARHRDLSPFDWSTLDWPHTHAELCQRILDAANMFNTLELNQRLKGTQLAKKFVEQTVQLMLDAWAEDFTNAGTNSTEIPCQPLT